MMGSYIYNGEISKVIFSWYQAKNKKQFVWRLRPTHMFWCDSKIFFLPFWKVFFLFWLGSFGHFDSFTITDISVNSNTISVYACIKIDWRLANNQYRLFSSPEPLGSQGELIVYPWSGVRPSSVVRRPSVVNNFKHLLLQNRLANQSQILCGACLGRGNESLFPASGSHDQDGRHAHIW